MNKNNVIAIRKDSSFLRFLYRTSLGRVLLRPLTAKWITDLSGWFLDSKASVKLIPGFVKKNGIDMSEYEPCKYKCFNEFFFRRVKPELRPVDMEPSHLIAPCDGLLSVYRIQEGLVMPIKQSTYSVRRLLRNGELADEFDGGICLVFRLCVNHYHRYHYADGGIVTRHGIIRGRYHTVRPIALESRPVFIENQREYTVIETENFGKVVQMEVGAMLVGKINNHNHDRIVKRGAEKGHFLYGGSTVIMMLKKDAVTLPAWMFEATKANKEIPVKMGEALNT